MAAYNCGPVNVQKAVERTGYADFWELRGRNVLPKETGSYLPVILAMTIIAKNPAAHGIETIDPDPPLEYSTVEIASPTHLALIGDVLECPVSQLQELNPALLRTVAPAHFLLRVPKGKDAAVISALDMVPASYRAAWRLCRVRSGDRLAGIASRYQVSLHRLAEVNQLDGAGPEEGNLLVIPAAPKPERVLTTRQPQPRRAPASRRKRGSLAAAAKRPAAQTVASRRTTAPRQQAQVR
jgi:membrane-bound lytic murein transglycosylase D